MDFIEFLTVARTPSWWQNHKNFCFVAPHYPSMWFKMLFDMIQAQSLLTIPQQRIFFEATDKIALYATLNQSILGAYSFFWLADITDTKESKSWQKCLDFLLAYQGPHTIAYFVNSSIKIASHNTVTIIHLPQVVTSDLIIDCIKLFDVSLDARKIAFIKKIVTPQTPINLDKACMLLVYLELISTKYLHDYEHFLTSITETSPTLSLLSECFFAKNAQQFFILWKKISSEYPDVFWITFWSEHIWKAYFVIQFLNNKNFAQAKRMSFRLPYSFINRDWQKTDQTLLLKAYNFLYQMDYALKTGSTFCSLDLFYVNYFSGSFK